MDVWALTNKGKGAKKTRFGTMSFLALKKTLNPQKIYKGSKELKFSL
jgi:hypothetical protein